MHKGERGRKHSLGVDRRASGYTRASATVIRGPAGRTPEFNGWSSPPWVMPGASSTLELAPATTNLQPSVYAQSNRRLP